MKMLRFDNIDGDWMMLASLAIEAGNRKHTLIFENSWGRSGTGPVTYDPNHKHHPFRPAIPQDKKWLEMRLEPWTCLPNKGIGVMMGEFGAYRHTPHGIVLAWMKDLLDVCNQAGFGWALWEFRGPFGLLDSQRADVDYVLWNGHQLDLEMLELLQGN
ncbi:MAG: hypothetical protein ACREIA_19115 [Opitutaceae bacterium]